MSKPDPCGGDGGLAVVMHHEATAALAPGVGTFDHPALGQGHEALGHLSDRLGRLRVVEHPGVAVGGVAYHLHIQVMGRLQSLGTCTAVGAIDEQHLEREQLGASLRDDVRGAVAVLHAGGGDRHRQQQPECVDHQMALAPLDLLAGIEARFASLWRVTGGLGIQHGRAGLSIASQALAPLLPQSVLHRLKHALCGPAAE